MIRIEPGRIGLGGTAGLFFPPHPSESPTATRQGGGGDWDVMDFRKLGSPRLTFHDFSNRLDAEKEAEGLGEWLETQTELLNSESLGARSMRPIDFAKLQKSCPEFRHVWPLLQDWFLRHKFDSYVAAPRLAADLRAVTPVDLVLAMREMIDRKMVASGFQVALPGGEILDLIYDRPTDIPVSLLEASPSAGPGARGADIVAGYRWSRLGGD